MSSFYVSPFAEDNNPSSSTSEIEPEILHPPRIQFPEQKEIVIAVMGVTGSGKSSLIKILAQDHSIVVGHGLESCTQLLNTHTATYQGTVIRFVDTPGFNDTNRTDTQILQEIAAWMSQTYRNNLKLSGIIYLHRISDNRMEGTALKNLRMFKRLCGDDALKNVVLTSTHWDLVTPELGSRREQELFEKYWAPMRAKGSQLKRFDGSEESAWDLVIPLLKMERTVLNIQHELVDEGKQLGQTEAGTAVNEELAHMREQHAKALAEARQEMSEAIREKDDEMKRLWSIESARLQKEIEKVAAQQSELNKREKEMKSELEVDKQMAGLRAEGNERDFWRVLADGVAQGFVGYVVGPLCNAALGYIMKQYGISLRPVQV